MADIVSVSSQRADHSRLSEGMRGATGKCQIFLLLDC